MTKTPEQDKGCEASQMAVDWYVRLLREEPAVAIKEAYQAGYQAAKDQLADAGKVMGELSRAFDQGYQSAKAHYQTDWISVKEQLPEYDQLVLLWQSELQAQFVGRRRESGVMSPLYYWECTSDFFEAWKEIYHPKLMNEEIVTYWMPLPKPPEVK